MITGSMEEPVSVDVEIFREIYMQIDEMFWMLSVMCARYRGLIYFACIAGKLVEEEEGSFAVWLSYLFTGVGANVVSWLILPRSVVSVGASGAVFGLFAISVLVKV